jgi:hypothetical protein
MLLTWKTINQTEIITDDERSREFSFVMEQFGDLNAYRVRVLNAQGACLYVSHEYTYDSEALGEAEAWVAV